MPLDHGGRRVSKSESHQDRTRSFLQRHRGAVWRRLRKGKPSRPAAFVALCQTSLLKAGRLIGPPFGAVNTSRSGPGGCSRTCSARAEGYKVGHGDPAPRPMGLGLSAGEVASLDDLLVDANPPSRKIQAVEPQGNELAPAKLHQGMTRPDAPGSPGGFHIQSRPHQGHERQHLAGRPRSARRVGASSELTLTCIRLRSVKRCTRSVRPLDGSPLSSRGGWAKLGP